MKVEPNTETNIYLTIKDVSMEATWGSRMGIQIQGSKADFFELDQILGNVSIFEFIADDLHMLLI